MQALTLTKVLSCPTLPSLPKVAMEVLELFAAPEVPIERIARVIHNDPALAARILKTVNSSFYSLATPCPTISRALTYLGLNTVKSIVLGFSLVEWTRSTNPGGGTIEFWSRSLHTAAVSRRLASQMKNLDCEEAFLAALLQDIGLLALRCAVEQTSRTELNEHCVDHLEMCEFCRTKFGLDHADIGAALARKWRLPSPLAQAIADHHCPISDLPSRPVLSHTVAAANHMVTAITSECAPQNINVLRDSFTKLLHITGEQFDEVIAAAAEDAREIARLLAVGLGDSPDVLAILSQAEELRMHHQLTIVCEAERLARTNSDLRRETLTDPLTGGGNRKHFDQQIARQLEHAKSSNTSLALLMIDVDHFKALNDAHGHQTGDAVLTELARRMRETASESAIACRYGGEEFTIIMPNVTRAQAAQLAESLRKVVAESSFTARGSGAKVPVTVSVGVALYEPSSESQWSDPSSLIRAADLAMFEAKQSGRNSVWLANPGRHTAAR